MTRLRDTLKQSLTQVGALSPISVLSSIEMTLNYLWVGRWMREKGFNPRRVESRGTDLRPRRARDRDPRRALPRVRSLRRDLYAVLV